MNKLIKTLLVLPFLVSCIPSDIKVEPKDIVFKNVNIISMTSDKIQMNKSIFISDGVIRDIGNYSDLNISKETEVIDCTGKFITPGFSDMHVHASRYEELNLFLANGVTTIRNMWGTPYHLEAREKIQNGELLGPEIFTTGPFTDGKNATWEGSNIITDPEKVEESITQMKKDGYDYVKIYDKLSPEVFYKIMEVAEKLEMPVVGHVPLRVNIRDAINYKLYSVEHFIGYNLKLKSIDSMTEVIDQTVQSGIWNCPTLVAMKNYKKLFEKHSNPNALSIESIPLLKYVSNEMCAGWEQTNGYILPYEKSKEFLNILNVKGANIVSGTDQGTPYSIAGFSLHEEFELMNESGLTPYEVLLTTTVNSARMLRIDNRSGTIEVGKDADLVLLEENPLINISNTRTIAGVMTKGKWLDSNMLEEMLNIVESNYSKQK